MYVKEHSFGAVSSDNIISDSIGLEDETGDSLHLKHESASLLLVMVSDDKALPKRSKNTPLWFLPEGGIPWAVSVPSSFSLE